MYAVLHRTARAASVFVNPVLHMRGRLLALGAISISMSLFSQWHKLDSRKNKLDFTRH